MIKSGYLLDKNDTAPVNSSQATRVGDGVARDAIASENNSSNNRDRISFKDLIGLFEKIEANSPSGDVWMPFLACAVFAIS